MDTSALILFLILSVPLVILSWRTIARTGSHGFYRFLAWESILLLFAFNYKYWFKDPFHFHQVCSWIFLLVSLYLVTAGALSLGKYGQQDRNRKGESLYHFEKTSRLVQEGIYKYIRHPLYASLIFLTAGIFLKHPGLVPGIISFFSIVFLYLTSILDEKECTRYFGEDYKSYKKKTKRFIPFLF